MFLYTLQFVVILFIANTPYNMLIENNMKILGKLHFVKPFLLTYNQKRIWQYNQLKKLKVIFNMSFYTKLQLIQDFFNRFRRN